jgi:phosphatidylserine/phosphatidylglycerophosphate/cardiolipin synthase-like enzyme
MLLSKNDIENLTEPIVDSSSIRMDMRVEQVFNESVPIFVEANAVYPFWTDGKWSYHQLIKQLILQVGKSDVYLSTWAITEEPLRVIHKLKKEGKISRLCGIFDYRLSERSPKGYAFAKEFFDEIILIENHSKVTIIDNDSIPISVIGSANWTKNKRLEAGVILTNKETAQQFINLFKSKLSHHD